MLPTPVASKVTPKAGPPATHQGLAVLNIKPGQALPATPGTYAILVSPTLAQDWLNRYADPKKRVIRPARVSDYAKDMAANNWVWGTANIVFVTNGAVALDNGHHRLSAIVKAGVPVWMQVVTGADPSIRSVTDIGLNRSGADNIKMWGGTSYTSETAAGVKLSLIYEQTVGTTRVWRGPSTFHLPTKPEQVQRWLDDEAANPGLWVNVAAAVKAGIRTVPHGIPPKALMTAVYLMEVKHPTKGIDFVNRLFAMTLPDVTGAFITAARTRPTGSGTQLEFDRWVMEVMVRAFNADVTGRTRWSRPARTGTPFTLSRIR